MGKIIKVNRTAFNPKEPMRLATFGTSKSRHIDTIKYYRGK